MHRTLVQCREFSTNYDENEMFLTYVGISDKIAHLQISALLLVRISKNYAKYVQI